MEEDIHIRELNLELTQFLYTVSHDMRAPLRAIDGFSAALEEDYAAVLNDTGLDFLRRIRNASRKLNGLFNALLDMSRETRGEMDKQPTDLAVLARKIVAGLQRNPPEHAPEFHIADSLPAYCDHRFLRIALEKLLDNAVKFTSRAAAPLVEVGSRKRGPDLVFFVRDNGVGFDLQYARDKLFSPFQRFHPENEFPGLGTGLATARRIIVRHGGNIWAESIPGKGADFYFTLPPQKTDG